MSGRHPPDAGDSRPTAPRWTRALLAFLTPRHREDDVLGDLEESHRARRQRRGAFSSWLLTGIEALDLSLLILIDRLRGRVPEARQPSEAFDSDVLTGLAVSWLDFKLGFRMLRRFPGLTVIGGTALAFAIALGVASFEASMDFALPTMPFEGGDRIVELWNRDLESGDADPRVLHDFEVWKSELETVDAIGGVQTFRRNLTTERGSTSPVVGAAISASAFEMARTPPFLGRGITATDESLAAEPVIVLGYDVWQSRFNSDPGVIGQTARLASERTTVVGVMPEGFQWPRAYSVWTPLRLDGLEHAWGEGPGLQVVGRRAPGASMGDVRAELATVGARLAADHPTARAMTKPEVSRWGALERDISSVLLVAMLSIQMLQYVGLMILVAGNVALLLFARTAARSNEIVIRAALGASRGRIVAQLFAEALILAAIATVVGLLVAERGLAWGIGMMEQVLQAGLGSWFRDGLSPSTMLCAFGFTVLAAVIAGVLPAMKATGWDMQARLQRAGTGGPTREAGRLWGSIIVTQVAVTVAFVPVIIVVGWVSVSMEHADYGFPAEQYLMAEIREAASHQTFDEMNRVLGGSAQGADYEARYLEIKRRLELEPAVGAIALAEQVPGAPQAGAWIEVDGPARPTNHWRGHHVGKTAVDEDFFRTLGVSIVAGRDFNGSDGEAGQHVVIVDEHFVHSVLEDRNPLGRRIRFNPWRENPDVEPNTEPWLEVVGVVEGLVKDINPEERGRPGIYVPLAADQVHPVRIAARVGAEPLSFGPRLREIVSEVDPELVITDLRPLDDSAWVMRMSFEAWFKVLLVMGGMGILLATAGIYAILSFTVSRRTREIGVRVALGADRIRIVAAILHRALEQIGLGVGIGGTLIAAFLLFNPELGYAPEWWHVGVFLGYLAFMSTVCALACIVPTSRALAVEPTEALRAEG